jgi:hypothetical protein
MLWQASKAKLDPDYPLADTKPVRTIALGLKLDF